jgi:hypothetical protein
MPDNSNEERSFIPGSLRPKFNLDGGGQPPLGPGLPPQELTRQAEQAMGPALVERLGLADQPPLPEEVYCRDPQVIWTALEGEAVLLNLTSGYYFSLNRVGAAIWELLDGERTLGAAQQAVCDRFQAPAATVWADLAALINHLRREKLITLRNGTDGAL